jgi:ectoine hydroxylase-related dioxygenase (phytanoyl-CoA dioxygenase family)
VFQTMTMRLGSEEPLHIDTGPLTVTEPMFLAAAWVALEDVRPRSGEFQYVPGSHALPEVLVGGASKAHHGDFAAYYAVLERTRAMCAERGLATESFLARKGDVLIWHADLMHGGAPIADRSLTRKSLVAHFMPLGAMPTFYDFSQVNALRYPAGGFCLDRLVPLVQAELAQPERKRPPSMARVLVDRIVDRAPAPLRGVIRRYLPGPAGRAG